MDIQPDRSVRSKRLTLGFLSENSTYDSESQILRGILEAAGEHDANVICFSPFVNDKELRVSLNSGYEGESPIRRKLDQMKRHIEAFDLDGLIILGWSREYDDTHLPYFRDLAAPAKIMSIGKPHTEFGIPSVISVGGVYIAELTRHLILQHNRRAIGYIPAWSGDERLDSYMAITREHGCFNERLIVGLDELSGITDTLERLERAMTILFDERGEKIDAVMTMNATEGMLTLEWLNRRGIRVPEDVALVCYEDLPAIAYTKPSLTTIDYPHRGLGYAACDNLCRLLKGEPIEPVYEVPAAIYYRDSCGCTMNGIIPTAERPPALLRPAVPIERVAAELRASYPIDGFDYAKLAERVLHDAFTVGGKSFLEQIWRFVAGLKPDVNLKLQQMLTRFRELMLPMYAHDPEAYARAEEMWFNARFVVRDYENTSRISAYIAENDIQFILNNINQSLLLTQTVDDILGVLNNNLGWIDIPSAYLLVNEGTSPNGEPRLLFAFTDYDNMMRDIPPGASTREIYRIFTERKNGRFSLMTMPLTANETQLGIGWFDVERHTMGLIYGLGVQISKSLKSALLLEESRRLVRQLSHEVELRKEKEAQLAYYAEIDSLSRLFNRRFFYSALERLAGAGEPFAVFYIDIDGFKQVNDTMGHHAGDELLKRIADRLREALDGAVFPLVHASLDAGMTESGSIFRLGGDEFTALLPLADTESIAARASRITSAMARPFELPEGTARVSASIGIGRYPEDTPDEQQLLRFADLALYEAKRSKDTFVFYRDTRK